jgi:hypothetical protein
VLVGENIHVGAINDCISPLGILRLQHILQVDTEEDLQIPCNQRKVKGSSHWVSRVRCDVEGLS